MGCVNLTGVLLAAGQGQRFGRNKLEALLGGEMLGLHGARTLAGLGLARLVAVGNPASVALNAAIAALGYEIILNPQAEAGLSGSLRLAVAAAGEVDGLLVMLGDMPGVTAGHLGALIEVFHEADGQQIVASAQGLVRMPPAIFPRCQFTALDRAQGDLGARPLLQGALVVQGDAEMLADIDTPEALATHEQRQFSL